MFGADHGHGRALPDGVQRGDEPSLVDTQLEAHVGVLARTACRGSRARGPLAQRRVGLAGGACSAVQTVHGERYSFISLFYKDPKIPMQNEPPQ